MEKIMNPQRIRALASNACAVRMTLYLRRGTNSYLLILLPKAISSNSGEQPTPFCSDALLQLKEKLYKNL